MIEQQDPPAFGMAGRESDAHASRKFSKDTQGKGTKNSDAKNAREYLEYFFHSNAGQSARHGGGSGEKKSYHALNRPQ